jgi:hypothetical protein
LFRPTRSQRSLTGRVIMTLLHERRAKLIHSLVDELSLEVKDWGGTDAPHPSEIVDLAIAFGPADRGRCAVAAHECLNDASIFSLRRADVGQC